MTKVRIIAEGLEWDPANDGMIEPLPVGTELEHVDAWKLCLTGFRNAPPRAEPADAETKAKVDAFLKARAPVKSALRAQMQNQVNALAADPKTKLQLDSEGDLVRDAKGEIMGNLTSLQRHRLETAESYGIVPKRPGAPAEKPATVPTNTKPAASVAAAKPAEKTEAVPAEVKPVEKTEAAAAEAKPAA